MSITLLEVAAGFAASYLANNIPVLGNADIEKRIIKCYDSARKEWKCKAVRDLYEGKEFMHLNDLKQYVIGKEDILDNELKELISRWALKMQSDPICAEYLNSLKIDELLSRTNEHPQLYVGIVEQMHSLAGQLSVIKDSIDKHDEALKEIKEIGDETKNAVEKIGQQIDEAIEQRVIRQPKDIDSIIQRYMNDSIKREPVQLEPVPACTSTEETRICLHDELIEESAVFDHFVFFLCCRGGLDWYSNPFVPRLLTDTTKKIETFANYNRYYLSEEAYSMLRQHYQSAENLRNAIELFVLALHRGFHQFPDEMTNAVDITYGQDIHICPEFINNMMEEFTSVYPSPEFKDLSDLYSSHFSSRERIICLLEQKRESAL